MRFECNVIMCYEAREIKVEKTHAPQNGLFKTKYCNYLELLVNSSRTYAHMLCAGLKFLVELWTVQWNRAEGAIKTTAAKLSNWLILESFIYTHSILFHIFFCCDCCIHSFGVLTFLWNVVEISSFIRAFGVHIS